MKENTIGRKFTRRGLLAGALRYSVLAVLGAGGAAGALKRRVLLREGECLNGGVCPGCSLYEDCGLPRARAIRARRSEC